MGWAECTNSTGAGGAPGPVTPGPTAVALTWPHTESIVKGASVPTVSSSAGPRPGRFSRSLLAGVAIATATAAMAACSSTSSTSPTTSPPATTAGSASPTEQAGGSTAQPAETATTQPPGPTSSPSGSTPSASTASGDTVTQAEFDAKATPICVTFQTKGSSIFSTTSPTQAQFDQGIAFLHDFESQLRGIGVPAGKQAQATAFYTDLDALIAVLQQIGPALVSGDPNARQTYSAQFDSVSSSLEASAKAFGLDSCFESTSAPGT